MATSQNGWTVITSGTHKDLVAIPKIIGRVRSGPVAVIFKDLVEYFDTHIEDVDSGRDDWGYAYRPIRGRSSGYSNHASGTAIDVNATRHPRGKAGTFTAAQRKKIQEMLKRYDGVVRWGGNYPAHLSLPDDMHFEINASYAAVKAVADKLEKADAPAEIVLASTVKPVPKDQVWDGLSKADATAVQKYLKNITGDYNGVLDGVYGPRTRTAVKKYQRRQNQYGRFGLVVDGYWGPKLQAHMDWVKVLQKAVAKWKASQRYGFLPVDGDYGHRTYSHVKHVQAVNGKPGLPYYKVGGRVADGVPGHITCKMLGIPKHP